MLLMGGAFWWLFTRLDSWIPSLMSHVPDWLQWLNYLLWPVVVSRSCWCLATSSTIANWIAAPFSGLLAEQLEARLTGAPPDVGVFGIMKDIPRIMKREWQKLAWYLPRAIVLLLLYFIPGVGQTVAPVLWFLFSAWMLAIHTAITPSITTRSLQNHARSAAQPQSDEYAVWRAPACSP
jgi:CysZ protein